jgi:hypothetical protein
VTRAPGAARRALAGAGAWVVVAARRSAAFLGGESGGSLLFFAAGFFGVLTLGYLIEDGRPPSLVTYAGTAGACVVGCVISRVLNRFAYRPAKRALAARALRRRG